MNWGAIAAIYRFEMSRFFRTLLQSFLSPVLAVLLGWFLLSEEIGPQVWAALGLVAAGVFLINRRPVAEGPVATTFTPELLQQTYGGRLNDARMAQAL